MKKFKYQLTRNHWRNERIICRGISEERLDEEYEPSQDGDTSDDFDEADFMEEE